RFPMLAQENLDISAHLFESRGLLHCEIAMGDDLPSLHCINVHLGLFERGRQWQIQALIERIESAVPHAAPLIIAGDFNDWRSKGDRAEYFPVLLEAIALAEREIWLETYIFADDETGRRVADALIAAARRGVTV